MFNVLAVKENIELEVVRALLMLYVQRVTHAIPTRNMKPRHALIPVIDLVQPAARIVTIGNIRMVVVMEQLIQFALLGIVKLVLKILAKNVNQRFFEGPITIVQRAMTITLGMTRQKNVLNARPVMKECMKPEVVILITIGNALYAKIVEENQFLEVVVEVILPRIEYVEIGHVKRISLVLGA